MSRRQKGRLQARIRGVQAGGRACEEPTMHLPMPSTRRRAVARRLHALADRLAAAPDPPDPDDPDEPGAASFDVCGPSFDVCGPSLDVGGTEADFGAPSFDLGGPASDLGGSDPARSGVLTVLPRRHRPHPAASTLTTYAGTLVAAAALVVAVIVPSPSGARAAQAAVAVPTVGVPAVPSGLPSALEDLAPYVVQDSCDPVIKPGVLKLQGLLLATYPGTSAWSPRPCGADGPGMASEHYEGRALDWSVSVRTALGAARAAAVIRWLLASDAAGHPYANARRLGIMYIIWNNQIWGSYRAAEGWRPYSTCAAHPEPGSDTTCHRDHIHFSLSWAGAQGRTSFWTRTVAATDYGPCRPADLNWAAPYTRANPAPCRSYPTVRAASAVSTLAASLVVYSGATVGPGATGPVVSAVQKALGQPADGRFGTSTGAAVSAFRTRHGLPAGTQVDAATWRALLAAFATAVPGTSGGGVTAKPAPVTASSPLAKYSGSVLSYGARSAAVTALQKALGVSPASGWFGPATRAAVLKFQAAHAIPRTGNVGPLTWHALGG